MILDNNRDNDEIGINYQKVEGITNAELQFEMAMRDQVIYSQREVQRSLGNLIISLGLDEKQIVELAAKHGISVEDIQMATLGLPNMGYSPNLKHKDMHGSIVLLEIMVCPVPYHLTYFLKTWN